MSKYAGKDTTFKFGSTTVGSLTSIGGVAASADTIDVTTMDSANGYKEFLGGWKDGGEVSLSGYFDYSDVGQTELYTAFESGASTACEIIFPSAMAAKWTFNGVVTAIETGSEMDGAVSFDCTIKVSGKPTLAAVSAG